MQDIQPTPAFVLPTHQELMDQLDRLAMSADAKAVLARLADVTVTIGGKLVRAGRRILAFVIDAVQRFPNTTFGLIAALVVSSLIASVPFLGAVLGPLLSPLLLAFGIGMGALADLKESALRARGRHLEQEFGAIRPVA